MGSKFVLSEIMQDCQKLQRQLDKVCDLLLLTIGHDSRPIYDLLKWYSMVLCTVNNTLLCDKSSMHRVGHHSD